MSSFRVVYFLLNQTIKASQVPVIQAFVTLFICYIVFYFKRVFHIFSHVLDGNGKIISVFPRQGR